MYAGIVFLEKIKRPVFTVSRIQHTVVSKIFRTKIFRSNIFRSDQSYFNKKLYRIIFKGITF